MDKKYICIRSDNEEMNEVGQGAIGEVCDCMVENYKKYLNNFAKDMLLEKALTGDAENYEGAYISFSELGAYLCDEYSNDGLYHEWEIFEVTFNN